MQRVYGLVDDELVHHIDTEAGERKVSRAQWVRMAVEAYLHRNGEQENLEMVNLRTALEEKDRMIAHLNGELAVKSGELEDKNGELDHLKSQLNQANIDATERWEELKGFRKEIDRLKKDLDETRSANQQLKDELLKRQSDIDRVANTREELAATRAERDQLQETLKIRNADVEFFKATVHQLNEMLPKQKELPPSEEEIKSKHWWQFWK